jgi:ankyrin repeat protein
MQNFLSRVIASLLPFNKLLNQNLLEAAETGDVSKVKILLRKRADVNARSSNVKTVWLIAKSKGSAEVVSLLRGL